jgi:hypothetical protein
MSSEQCGPWCGRLAKSVACHLEDIKTTITRLTKAWEPTPIQQLVACRAENARGNSGKLAQNLREQRSDLWLGLA